MAASFGAEPPGGTVCGGGDFLTRGEVQRRHVLITLGANHNVAKIATLVIFGGTEYSRPSTVMMNSSKSS